MVILKKNVIDLFYKIKRKVVAGKLKKKNLLSPGNHRVFIKETAFVRSLLWNHFYSWGLMFLGNQNFPGLWGRYFVGKVIRIILIDIKQMIVYWM